MENHGVLVGWRHHDLGNRAIVTLETTRRADKIDPDLLQVAMTKEQANILGHDLIRIAGQTAPSATDRGWFRRVFG